MKWKTRFVNTMGSIDYPIYLIDLGENKYDLECEHEIYALAWYHVFIESIKDYKEEIK